MWTSDDFPGADHVPWQLLIRARTQFEVDALVASQIVRAVSLLASEGVAKELAQTATKAVAASRVAHSGKESSNLGFSLSAFDDFEDWCGTRWPHWWGPKPHGGGLGGPGDPDPIIVAIADKALVLLRAAGSPQLQGAMSGPLESIAAGQA